MAAPKFLVIASHEVTSGVNETGEPFCSIRVTSTEGTIMLGQLPPADLRAQAMGDLECAVAADQDAAMWRVIQKLDLPDALAALVIRELREAR